MAKITEKPKVTIIYSTANIENRAIEKYVRQTIIKHNTQNFPIISISRSPISFGKNYSIGKRPSVSYSSFLKQVLKGLKKAKTEFALITKADNLYPPEFFEFIPPKKDKVYFYKNIYSLGDKFWQRYFTQGSYIAGTKYLIEIIENLIDGHPGWRAVNLPVLPVTNEHTWTGTAPIINIITENCERRFPKIVKGTIPRSSVPFWGNATELKQKIGI